MIPKNSMIIKLVSGGTLMFGPEREDGFRIVSASLYEMPFYRCKIVILEVGRNLEILPFHQAKQLFLPIICCHDPDEAHIYCCGEVESIQH